jgi:hypothetical protein
MVTPLQIDSYTRDLWQEYDALAIAQLAPLAYDKCYKPKIIVCLDTQSQTVPALGYAQAGIRIRPGSIIYGFQFGNLYAGTPQFNFQITDVELRHQMFSEPVSQSFLVNQKGVNYPNPLTSPYPVVGKGRFLFEVWNQLNSVQIVIPLLVTLEPQ